MMDFFLTASGPQPVTYNLFLWGRDPSLRMALYLWHPWFCDLPLPHHLGSASLLHVLGLGWGFLPPDMETRFWRLLSL